MNNETRRLPLPPTDILTVLVTMGAIVFVLAFGGKLLEAYRLQRYNDTLRANRASLLAQQQQLQGQLKYVQTPEYVEKVAREQYKWAKPGEKVVIPLFRTRLAAATAGTSSRPATSSENQAAGPWWSAWWKALTGSFD